MEEQGRAGRLLPQTWMLYFDLKFISRYVPDSEATVIILSFIQFTLLGTNVFLLNLMGLLKDVSNQQYLDELQQ